MADHGTIRFKLDDLLTSRGWSDYRLSKESGVQPIVIAKYRNNNVSAPPLETLAKLCAALNCSVGELMEYVPDSARPGKKARAAQRKTK